FVRDRAFNACLGARLDALRDAHCRRITLDALPHGTLWQALTGPIAFHILRRFPAWAGLLPAHRPASVTLAPGATPEGAP
ncbi:MAG TPA: cardiolipin synthase B, partial [Lysobacter sp.]